MIPDDFLPGTWVQYPAPLGKTYDYTVVAKGSAWNHYAGRRADGVPLRRGLHIDISTPWHEGDAWDTVQGICNRATVIPPDGTARVWRQWVEGRLPEIAPQV